MRRIALCLALVLTSPDVSAQPTRDIATLAKECRAHEIALSIDWRPHPWDCREEPARTLSQALRYQEESFGSDDVVYRVGVDSFVCQTLRAIGMAECSYIVHHTLVGFLAMYGVELFPVSDSYHLRPADNQYRGYGPDVDVLIRAIRHNQDLFADGELTHEEVKQWQRVPNAE